MPPSEEADALKAEADELLVATGLIDTLAAHGDVTFTGSYLYGLMTWRDVDVCLSVAEEPMRVAVDVVTQISKLDILATVYVRNEHVLMTDGNPRAVFVCVELLPEKARLWKVDILIGAPHVVEETIAPGRELVSKLTTPTRESILRIKSELCRLPDYRRRIRSTDIYHAVIDYGVRTLDEGNVPKAVDQS